MLIRYWSAVTPALLAVASVSAQQVEPTAAGPEAAASAASSAAMARARRQAAGPMRFILEASRSRRRVVEAEPAATADAGSARPVSSRSDSPAPEPIEARVPEATQPPAAVQAPAEAQAPADTAVTVAPDAQDAESVLEITLNSRLLQVKAPDLAPALPPAVAPFVSPLGNAGLAMPRIGAGPARPTLVSQVDPDVPQQVLDELGANAVVPIDITIRANGTVAAVALAGRVPRGLQRAVQSAVGQWRFEPLPGERIHRVELVFNPDR